MAVQLSKLLREIQTYLRLANQADAIGTRESVGVAMSARIAASSVKNKIYELQNEKTFVVGKDKDFLAALLNQTFASTAIVALTDDNLYVYSEGLQEWRPVDVVNADDVLIGGDDAS